MISVSNYDIEEEYNKYKDTKYRKSVIISGEIVKKPIPFNDVKDGIKNKLNKKNKRNKINAWKKALLDEYNFRIDDNMLVGK